MKLSRMFLSVSFLILAAVAVQAQPSVVSFPNTSQAPVKSGLAAITVSGDARPDSGDPTWVENGRPVTYAGYIEVWFANNSGGDATASPATAYRAKIYRFDYNTTGSGNSVFIVAIPEDSGLTASNPYVRIMQDNGGSYSQFTEFQMSLSTGGTLSTRPFFLLSDTSAISGKIKALGNIKVIQPVGTNTLLDSENVGGVNSVFLTTVWMYGVASGADVRIEISSPGKVTTTLSGSSLNVTRVPGYQNVTEVTFELPTQFNPVTGSSGFDISLRAKIGASGTWSPTEKITVQ